MKEMLGHLADGQIEFYKAVRLSGSRWLLPKHLQYRLLFQAMEEWERIIPIIQRIRVDV